MYYGCVSELSSVLMSRYRACAIGKGRALAKTELEKVVGRLAEGETVNCREGVIEVARM